MRLTYFEVPDRGNAGYDVGINGGGSLTGEDVEICSTNRLTA